MVAEDSTSLLELLTTAEATLEGAVGLGSSKGTLPPVEPTRGLGDLVVAVVESLEMLDSLVELLDALELDTPVPLLKVKFEGGPGKRSLEVVLAVGCTSLVGMLADDGCSENVGDTISSLLGMPIEGCLEELELVVNSTSVEVVVALELGAVGCTASLGAVPADGCCANLSPDRVLLRVVELRIDDDVSAELGAVGCTGESGDPLEGVLKTLASSVLDSYSSLVVVVEYSEEELGAVGSTIVSGSPVDGCVDSAGVVG